MKTKCDFIFERLAMLNEIRYVESGEDGRGRYDQRKLNRLESKLESQIYQARKAYDAEFASQLVQHCDIMEEVGRKEPQELAELRRKMGISAQEFYDAAENSDFPDYPAPDPEDSKPSKFDDKTLKRFMSQSRSVDELAKLLYTVGSKRSSARERNAAAAALKTRVAAVRRMLDEIVVN